MVCLLYLVHLPIYQMSFLFHMTFKSHGILSLSHSDTHTNEHIKPLLSHHPQEGQFLVSDLQRVMGLDAQLTSHPIVQPVNHPDEITEIFDVISYSKVSMG